MLKREGRGVCFHVVRAGRCVCAHSCRNDDCVVLKIVGAMVGGFRAAIATVGIFVFVRLVMWVRILEKGEVLISSSPAKRHAPNRLWHLEFHVAASASRPPSRRFLATAVQRSTVL